MAKLSAFDPALAAPADVLPAQPSPGYWKAVAQRLLRDKVTLLVTALLLAILIIAIFAPVFAIQDPLVGSVLRRLKPIGTEGHWLGTDETGRDIWARLCYGARLSVIAGVTPVLISLVIGGFLGVTAGYMGGLANTLIMRTMDVFYAFPSILLAIAICGLLGNGLTNAILALSIVFIPPMVRIAETVTTQARHLDFRHDDDADHPLPCAVQRARRHPGLRHQPDQPVDHPVCRPVVPRPGRDAAAAGMGADAEFAAPGHLCAAVGRRPAGCLHLCHVHVLQPDE